MRLPSLSALRAFEVAARLRSFKKAADELAVTPTAISHRIRVLEKALERPLFVRKVRAVELTDEARTLYVAVHSGFETMAAAVEHFRQPARARVTVSATPAFAAKWLVPRLSRFHAQHPGVDLHVHATNEPVDLDAGDADVAVRYGLGVYKGLSSRELMRDGFAPVASPQVAGRRGSSRPYQWLLIHFDWQRPVPVDLTWGAWATAAGLEPGRMQAGTRYSDESHAIQAAVAGQGVALLSVLLVRDELRLGLLQVMPGPQLPALGYHLVQSRRTEKRREVQWVCDWLVQECLADET
ncbi:Glycine cleavage system transcriptional activator [bioreactor metagenome]|uniref:Glycine cleavage system transcriptional activator n=1 Tax=bioreactor metagenome TaxID=1076179 RepID=A0A644ZW12_9ZZZZ